MTDGHGVSDEQRVDVGGVDRDAARAVAGCVNDPRASREVEYLTVCHSRHLFEHQNFLAFGAGIDAALDRYDRVATALGASEVIASEGHPMRWDAVPYIERITREAKAALGDETFDEHRAKGARMEPDEVTEFLLEV